ncbi:MAG: dephospho-CoA kinase [Nitrospirae bacterium RIFCSPLOW2_12_42_9]|nr:MAG: dephospho-CoA kinase [Nitrospirae bacterium RIFCSPLOW2_12_42_9]
MLLVGLTGGIATGKSVVSGILKSLGAYIIDADLIARDLVMPGMPAWHEIVERFGNNILLEDRSINRKLLGSIIFKDPQKRMALNSILHPRIFEEAEKQIKKIESEKPDAIVILDVALLIETKAYNRVDVVILVCADEELQIKRLIERDELTREDALERISTQMPSDMKKGYADFIIDTSTSQEDVRDQTLEIFEKLKGLSNT